MRLKDRVAVVTSSGQGIGKEIALVLAKQGAKLVIIARSESVLNTLEEVQAFALGRGSVVKSVLTANKTSRKEAVAFEKQNNG